VLLFFFCSDILYLVCSMHFLFFPQLPTENVTVSEPAPQPQGLSLIREMGLAALRQPVTVQVHLTLDPQLFLPTTLLGAVTRVAKSQLDGSTSSVRQLVANYVQLYVAAVVDSPKFPIVLASAAVTAATSRDPTKRLTRYFTPLLLFLLVVCCCCCCLL
jgi:hypothetical protein